MKLPILLTTSLFFLVFSSLAQPICGFDPIHQKLLKTDPVYRQKNQEIEASIQRYVELHKNQLEMKPNGTLSTFIVPVVVHVIHTGGAIGTIYNPTDAQILSTIDYLNQVYNGTWPGTTGAGDLGVQFVMAQRDPNCNPTNGINRVDGSGVSGYITNGINSDPLAVGSNQTTVKNLSRWDNLQYYNIWVVNKIDGADGTSGQFIAGFAFFPGASASLDGTVMLATQMVPGQKTLPHEVGHAFSLYHPFEGSSDSTQCPSGAGDHCVDTDPITFNQGGGVVDFTCRSGINKCTNTPYTANTESNYMNYTNCYNLFTADQKANMQGSAATSPRSSLGTSLGGTSTIGSCTPKINFELTEDQTTEATVSTSGCRKYKDYTYNMVIGNDPSAAATATLTVGGTATEGVDYDVTTNGNFAAPSKTLNFSSGSHTAQSFTVRIYDDASVESQETITLGFNVNSGSGNAIKGDGRTTLTIKINDNDSAPVGGTTTGTVNIGTAAFVLSSAPFDVRQQSARIQMLYKASELTAAGAVAGPLSGISFNLQKNSTRAYTNFNIKMGAVPAATTYLVNGSVTVASETIVKTLASYTTVNGWNDFTFDTPFTWDGTSNVVVEICFDNGSTAAGDAADGVLGYSDGGTGTQGNLFYQNAINCSTSFSSVTYFVNGVKPIIKLVYGIPATPIESSTASKQEYLGPNADVYFYDQTDGKLMARIQNLSSHDYGCTQVLVDRTGSSSVQFWNNNTANYLANKTFKVIPTTNNVAGNYTITLYYAQAEINGWQTATTQNISNAQMVKVATQISDVTPANPNGGGTVTTVTPVIASFGANTTVTATFSNGFSGFGIGIPGAALPITLLDFNGRLKSNSVELNWTTSSEQNSKSFEIERSYDGSVFVTAGTVAAAGNSNTTRSYSFTDPEIAQENNYYRLKQIDLDGKFIYSKVVLVKNPQRTVKFKVLTNPFMDNIDVDFGKAIAGKIEIKLLDVTGKELYRSTSENVGQSRLRINFTGSKLANGIYLLDVRANNEHYVTRVMKQ